MVEIITGWWVGGERKQELVKVDTNAYNCAKCRGIPHFWCPERGLWISFDDMIQQPDGWYTLV